MTSIFAVIWCYFELINTGTSFISVIVNAPAPVELVIALLAEKVHMRLILQLIGGISRVLQN